MKQLQQQAQFIFLLVSLFLGAFSLEANTQCTYFEAEQIPTSPELEGYSLYDNLGGRNHRDFYIYSDYQSPPSGILVEYDGEKLEKISSFPPEYLLEGIPGYLMLEGKDESKYFGLRKNIEDFINNKFDYFRFDDAGYTALDSSLGEGQCIDQIFDDENGVVYAIVENCGEYGGILYRLDGAVLTPISDVNTHGLITNQVYGGADFSLFGSEKGLLIYEEGELTLLIEDDEMGFKTVQLQGTMTSFNNKGELLIKGGAFRADLNFQYESVLFTYDGEILNKFPLAFHGGNFDLLIAFEAPNGDIYLSDASSSLNKFDGTSVEKLEYPDGYTIFSFTNYYRQHTFEKADGGYYLHMKNFQDTTAPPIILDVSLNGETEVINLPEGFTPHRWIEGEKDIAILKDANNLFQFFEHNEGSLSPILSEKYVEVEISYSDVGRLATVENENEEEFVVYFSEDEIQILAKPSGMSSFYATLFHNKLIVEGSGLSNYFILNNQTGFLSEIQTTENYPHIILSLVNEHDILFSVANYFSITGYPQLFRIKESTCEIALPAIEVNDLCPGDDLVMDMGDYESKTNYSLQYQLYNANNNTLVDKNGTGIFPSTDLPLGTYKVCVYEEWDNCKPEPSPIGGEVGNLNDIGNIESGCSQYVCTENIILTTPMEEGEESATLIQVGNNLIYTIEVCGGTLPYTRFLTESDGFVTTAILPSASVNCQNVQVTYSAMATWTLEVMDETNCNPISIAHDDLPGNITLLPQITAVDINKEKCPNDLDGAIDITVENGDTSCGDYTYQWTGANLTSATTEDLSNIGSGTYNVTVTDCADNSVTGSYYVGRAGGGGGRARGRGGCKTAGGFSTVINLYATPNPFQFSAQIRFAVEETEEISIQLFDISGRIIRTVFKGQAEENMDYRMDIPQTETLPIGTYIVRLTTESGHIQHTKLMKAK